jgi:hypothetical protein
MRDWRHDVAETRRIWASLRAEGDAIQRGQATPGLLRRFASRSDRAGEWPGSALREQLAWLLGLRRTEFGGDPEVAQIAEAIAGNLAALGLHVKATRYREHFWEIVASTSPNLVTTPGGTKASGVALMLGARYDPPTLVFEEINSRTPGLGSKMVGAVLAALDARPERFPRIRVDDSSPRGADGLSFWERIAARDPRRAWDITQNEAQRGARG